MSSAKRSRNRELLFCITQPVVDGWLTTTLVLQYDFTHDRSKAHELRVMSKARVPEEALHPDLPGDDAVREDMREGVARDVQVPSEGDNFEETWDEVDEEPEGEEEDETCED